MAVHRARTARGAVAGALAAAAWAAQQPLDKRVAGSRYDDVELLGKAVTRDPAWHAVGVSMHVAHGAAFGALYANLAPLLPLPRWARGPVVAMVEHLASWPLVRVTDRVHPARDELPRLHGDARAFALATWRHLLYGIVLGELERRLNAPEPDEPAPFEVLVSPNGHGELEHAVAAGSADEAAGPGS